MWNGVVLREFGGCVIHSLRVMTREMRWTGWTRLSLTSSIALAGGRFLSASCGPHGPFTFNEPSHVSGVVGEAAPIN